MLGAGYVLKIAKINFQQEKPICPNRKNWFLQNTKSRQSAKINAYTHWPPRLSHYKFFSSPLILPKNIVLYL